MKELTMFYLDDCGYCAKARQALDELFQENPAYAAIPLRRIEESREPALADTYDYYAVPSYFVDGKKIFEARLFMSHEDIKAGTRAALDAALEA